MSSLRFIFSLVILMPTCAMSQQVWDEMDIIDGPNPTLRYGFYTQASGQVAMGRYYFIDDGDSLRVRLVPFGKTAVELPVHKYDRDNGVLKLSWDGKPNRRCRLDRRNDALFLGNCIENLMIMPLAIRVANEYDEEWQGLRFPGDYAHMLRDINNNDSISAEELIMSLEKAYTALQNEMGSIWQ